MGACEHCSAELGQGSAEARDPTTRDRRTSPALGPLDRLDGKLMTYTWDYVVEMKLYFHTRVEAVLIKAGNKTTHTVKNILVKNAHFNKKT